jgi:hypothetical protein
MAQDHQLMRLLPLRNLHHRSLLSQSKLVILERRRVVLAVCRKAVPFFNCPAAKINHKFFDI